MTNPAIDPLREGLVMSLESHLGARGNFLQVRIVELWNRKARRHHHLPRKERALKCLLFIGRILGEVFVGLSCEGHENMRVRNVWREW